MGNATNNQMMIEKIVSPWQWSRCFKEGNTPNDFSCACKKLHLFALRKLEEAFVFPCILECVIEEKWVVRKIGK